VVKPLQYSKACTELLKNGIRVGVITNDQGMQLVDTGFIRNADIPVLEVPNGCFCCNYNQLERSIQSLQDTTRPAVIFAESVGSCTDLVATVLKPMLQFRPDIKVVISVFTDVRILPVMVKGSRLFADVNYIYKKQVEEADVIIVNKTDLITSEHLKI
jgi:G3E family GTPase